MKERLELNPLLKFIDDLIESGAIVQLIDQSDPDNVVEHTYSNEKVESTDESEVEIEIPFTDDSCPYDGSCDECPYEKECAEDLGFTIDDEEPVLYGIPDIDHIVFSGPATIVFWEDGTKTVVKCMEGEKFERYAGFAAACMKKMFGSTSRAKSVMDYFTVEQLQKKEKKSSFVGKRTDLPVVDESLGIDHETIMEAVNEALER